MVDDGLHIGVENEPAHTHTEVRTYQDIVYELNIDSDVQGEVLQDSLDLGSPDLGSPDLGSPDLGESEEHMHNVRTEGLDEVSKTSITSVRSYD